MDDARKDRLLFNLQALPTRLSALAMGAGGVLGVIWTKLPPDQQRALIEHSPLPAWAYPIALTVAGILSQVWPRKNKVAADEAAPTPIVIPTEKDRAE